MSRIFLLLILLNLATASVLAQYRKSGSNHGLGSLWAGALIGPSQLVEKAPDSLIPEIRDYLNKLRSGWHYGFETEYFFNQYIGVGAKYVSFNTRQAVDSIVVKLFSKTYYIDLSSKMNINTVSPMVYGRLPLMGNKLSLTGGIGPAWLFYRNIGKAVGDTLMFKGSSPGLSTSFRISYEVIPNLNVALQAGYIRAFLKKFTQDDGSTEKVVVLAEENYQNLSRYDLSFGLFYTFRRK